MHGGEIITVIYSRSFNTNTPNYILFFRLGLFFVVPCIDSYKAVDLRVVSFDVPPQEVSFFNE
jgi:regulator of protease activity HflC (stomatin/prohibitin superfamily)